MSEKPLVDAHGRNDPQPQAGDVVFFRSHLGTLRMMRITEVTNNVCDTERPGFYGNVILPEVENPRLRKFWGENSQIVPVSEVDLSEFRSYPEDHHG